MLRLCYLYSLIHLMRGLYLFSKFSSWGNQRYGILYSQIHKTTIQNTLYENENPFTGAFDF